MYARLTRLLKSLRETMKSPVAVSLVVALGIIGVGIFMASNSQPERQKSTAQTLATSTLASGDKEFEELLRRVPQLLATSSASSTLSVEQKKYFEDYLKSEGDRIGGAMVKSMVTSVDKRKFEARYTIKDLKVISDDSETALRQYAHDAGVITNKYAALKVETPESIMGRSLKSKDRSILLSLGTPATDYKNLAEELRALPVPQSIAQQHLAVVNAYDLMSRSLFELVRLYQDPMTGTAAWQVYIAQGYYMTKGFAGVIVGIHKQGVNFTDKNNPSYNFRWRE